MGYGESLPAPRRIDVVMMPPGEGLDEEAHALRMIEHYTEVAHAAELKRWELDEQKAQAAAEATSSAFGKHEAIEHETLQKLADLRQRAATLQEAMMLASKATDEFLDYLRELPDVDDPTDG